MTVVTILIVDDHKLVRIGIRRLLEDNPRIEVIGEAADGESGIELAASLRPDIILMDIHMPGIGGLEATHRLLQLNPTQKIIILTAHADGPLPKALIKAGAAGYVSKSSGLNEMEEAIEAIHKGNKYISQDIAQKLAIAMLDSTRGSPFDALTQRELQIIMLVAQGLRTQEMAAQLNLSPKTISTYRSRIMDKLGVISVVELMKLAEHHGLTERNLPLM